MGVVEKIKNKKYTLEEYLALEKLAVQTWYKEDKDLWRISSAFGLDKVIHLHSIDCKISLKDIYRRVNGLGNKELPNAY